MASLGLALAACAGPFGAASEQAPEASAFLVVRSNVRDDVAHIDGRAVGSTGPRAHAVSPGRHSVRVSKPGYADWETSLELAADETRTVKARLVRRANRAGGSPEPSWDDTIAFLRERLRDHWGGGEPPTGFTVSDEGVAVFRVRNPVDPAVWHHYSVDLREMDVALRDYAPEVVNLSCAAGTPCIRERLCRSGGCFRESRSARQEWIFADGGQGVKVQKALDHLIGLARGRPVPANNLDDLF